MSVPEFSNSAGDRNASTFGPSIQVRGATPSEQRLSTAMKSTRWKQASTRLARPTNRHLLVVDDELVGSTSTARAAVGPKLTSCPASMNAVELRDQVQADSGGDWLLKTGLFFDPRIRTRRPDRVFRALLRRAGPLVAALGCRRRQLTGYLAGVTLRNYDRFESALDISAYVQQVEAGSIDEPLLVAHLAYGARTLALIEETLLPVAVVCWRR